MRMRRLFYRLEFWGALGLRIFLRALPLDKASSLSGRLLRWVGPTFLRGVDRMARQNLKAAFPDWSEQTVTQTLAQMWDHWGRVIAEFFHGHTFSRPEFSERIEVHGADVLTHLSEGGRPILFISAHLGHWQILSLVVKNLGIPIAQFYSPTTNPFTNSTLSEALAPFVNEGIPKTRQSFKDLLLCLREGKSLLILADQATRTDLQKSPKIPFFGRPVSMPRGPVQLALRTGAALVMGRVERLNGGAYFRVSFDPPLDSSLGEDALLRAFNERLECWIRETPEQWFWFHNRWK